MSRPYPLPAQVKVDDAVFMRWMVLDVVIPNKLRERCANMRVHNFCRRATWRVREWRLEPSA